MTTEGVWGVNSLQLKEIEEIWKVEREQWMSKRNAT